MNKKAIADTALCRYDEKEQCYIVESPLFDRVTGVAETADEARQIFNELLDETYVAYLEGKLVGYDKRGRPAKGNVEFHAQVKPEVKAQISERAKALGISQGDVIAYLAAVAELKPDFERQILELKRKVQDQDDHVGQQKTAV
jgi:predicted RNase H-like HicB family nuclease